jgi:hypothetical protein
MALLYGRGITTLQFCCAPPCPPGARAARRVLRTRAAYPVSSNSLLDRSPRLTPSVLHLLPEIALDVLRCCHEATLILHDVRVEVAQCAEQDLDLSTFRRRQLQVG